MGQVGATLFGFHPSIYGGNITSYCNETYFFIGCFAENPHEARKTAKLHL